MGYVIRASFVNKGSHTLSGLTLTSTDICPSLLSILNSYAQVYISKLLPTLFMVVEMPEAAAMFWKLRVPEFFCAFCIGLFAFLFGGKVAPFCRPFDWSDETINREYKGSTFPSYSLAIMGVLPCFVYVAVINARRRSDTVLDECVAWALSQSVACALAMLFVDIPKVFAGRLRPDFLNRLRSVGVNSTMIGVDYCSIPDGEVRDGRLSFPSGHCGLSFAAVFTLTQFLIGEIQPFRHASFPRFLICIIPLVLPYIVAISRTRDNVHHFSDILCGSIIGIFCSVIGVRLHFLFSDGPQSFKLRLLSRDDEVPASSNYSPPSGIPSFNASESRQPPASL